MAGHVEYHGREEVESSAWLAAYEDALERGLNEEDAREAANEAVLSPSRLFLASEDRGVGTVA